MPNLVFLWWQKLVLEPNPSWKLVRFMIFTSRSLYKKFKYNLNLPVIHTCIHPGEVSTHIKLFLTILLNVKYGVYHLPCFGRYTLSTFYWNMPHMLCNTGNMYMYLTYWVVTFSCNMQFLMLFSRIYTWEIYLKQFSVAGWFCRLLFKICIMTRLASSKRTIILAFADAISKVPISKSCVF